MKKLVLILFVTALSACATQQPTPFEPGEVIEVPAHWRDKNGGGIK